MFIPNQTEIAWAAGFFDGEGCTTAYKNHRFTPMASLSQAGPKPLALLERFRQALGGLGTITGPVLRNPKHQPIYSWHVTGYENCQAVIAILWKYLGPIKREQATKRFKQYQERVLTRARLYSYQVERLREAWRNGARQKDLAKKYEVAAVTVWEYTKDIEPEKCNFGHPRTPENRYVVRRKGVVHETRCKQCQAAASKRVAQKKLATAQ